MATDKQLGDLVALYSGSQAAKDIYASEGEEGLLTAVRKAMVLQKSAVVESALSGDVTVSVSDWAALKAALASAAVDPDKLSLIIRDIGQCIEKETTVNLGAKLLMLYESARKQFGI